MVKPAIGNLDKRLTIFPRQRVSDGAGGWKTTKGAPFIIWAKIRQLTPRELIKYQAHETEIDTIIECRYHAAITKGSTAQLKERGRTRNFIIEGQPVDEELTYRFLEIEAKEVF
jgi:SPP1 family predicted phage head-tail adaptor